MTDINNEFNIDPDIYDEDIGKMLAILHDIPEAPLPDSFNMRLGEALKYEGLRIREQRQKSVFIKRKGMMKAAAAIAACFVVVFASVSVYNNNIPSLSSERGEESAPGDALLKAAAPYENIDDMGSPKMADEEAMPAMGGYDTAAKENSAAESLQEPQISGGIDNSLNAGGQDPADGGLYYGIQSTEADTLSREGSKCVKDAQEYRSYLKLIEVHLSGYEYEVTACEKDTKTGICLFTVLLIKDPEGQSINKYIALRGEAGVIYEEQAEEPDSSGD
ncbi:hypothetical protein MASR2M70_01010 [Bacillota bacterium]